MPTLKRKMKLANLEDKKLIIEILTKSFSDNKSVNYIVKQDKRRISRIRALMDYSFDVCQKWGKVYLSDNKKGCALVLYPHLKNATFKAIFLDIKLIFNSIGIDRIGKAMKREKMIKSRYPSEPFTYLWFIGVEPSQQKNGTGGCLLKEVIDESEGKGLDVLLETSTLPNVPWYSKFDFVTYDTILFENKLFMMKRTARKHN